MTAEQIASLAGVLLSLLFAYVPGVEAWYGGLDGTVKRIVMGVLLIVAAAGSLGWSCYQTDPATIGACVAANWQTYLAALVAALVANQATYLLAVKK